MHISLSELASPKNLRITGDEAWLGRIYGDFPLGKAKPPKLTGELQVRLEAGGSVLVTGRFSFAPIVACSRCEDSISWPLDVKVETRFQPARANTSDPRRDVVLTEADLELYFIEDEAVDLEAVLNDLVHTELPTRILATTADGSACRICLQDLSDDRVYGQSKTEEASPFAALKGLKLKN